MSILPAAGPVIATFLAAHSASITPPATGPATQAAHAAEPGMGSLLLVLAVGALGLLALMTLFRPGRVMLPDRLPPDRPAWPLAAVAGMGLLLWLGSSTVWVTYKRAQFVQTRGPDARFDASMLTTSDYALLATLPPAVTFLGLVLGDATLGMVRRLGYGPRQLARGAALGAVGAAAVVPAMFYVLTVTELAYRKIGYQHPPEHDLLRVLGDADGQLVSVLIILGATVLAPLFEELLFRGHLQTLLRRGFFRLSDPGRVYLPAEAFGAPAPAVFATAAPDGGRSQAAPVPYFNPSRPHDAPVPPVWASWAAIFITSVVFAAVHPAWTWPPIFVLSLGLGYAYERTGNLWTPMVIHALFNLTMTVLYLRAAVPPR